MTSVIDRRAFVTMVGGGILTLPSVALAQQPAKIPLVGFLGTSTLFPGPPEPFLQGLHDLGYVEGRNVVVEFRSAEGKLERLPTLAAELVALKTDVIVTAGGTPAAVAVKQATTTLPVVFTDAGDPV